MKQEIINLIKKQTKLSEKEIESSLEVPPNSDLGDFAFPCFSLARFLKKNPVQIAQDLSSKIKSPNLEKVEAKGPYVNFFIEKSKFIKDTLSNSQKKDFGSGNHKGKIIIEYSSPNMAKHFGIHNLRSTLIGHSLYNIIKFSGYNVKSINYFGDWGTQFGKLIVEYKKLPNKTQFKINAQSSYAIYVKFHELAEKDKSLEEEARREFKKLESGDKENLKIWKKFRDASLEEFEKVYKILGIKFDETKGESNYRKKVLEIINLVRSKNLLKESENALIIEIEGEKPPLILQKSNEASTYATRDLAAIQERLKTSPEKILYIVDIAQSLHFEQVFEAAEKIFGKNKILEHVKFGRLSFKDMKMSTRKGQVILFEDLLEKSKEKILSLIKNKSPHLKNKERVAQKIALASIIFNDLRNFRTHDIIFDWDSALSFEGRTGSYILYTNSRANSILKKSKNKAKPFFENLEEKEISLVKKIGEFPEVIEKATAQYAPSTLAEYAYNLCQIYNEFYHSCQVIDSENEARRILITKRFISVLKKSLDLLGMPCVDEM